MSLDYEKKKYKVLKEMVDNYRKELLKDREYALDLPIETENGFNIEREVMILSKQTWALNKIIDSLSIFTKNDC